MSSSEQPARQDARVSTGVPGLDAVLGGGLVSSGVYIFVGEPGAGKTLLGCSLLADHHPLRHGDTAALRSAAGRPDGGRSLRCGGEPLFLETCRA
ncbi:MULTISPECIES: ATPase domain-containing protein [Myxococcus]|uniref:RAD55 family ATPase n=1 Tax=Myxococcus TaxID=32 RepID=UPI001E3DBAE9|nr:MULTISPECIES: ATPase domain-containing protein [Myxococcus]